MNSFSSMMNRWQKNLQWNMTTKVDNDRYKGNFNWVKVLEYLMSETFLNLIGGWGIPRWVTYVMAKSLYCLSPDPCGLGARLRHSMDPSIPGSLHELILVWNSITTVYLPNFLGFYPVTNEVCTFFQTVWFCVLLCMKCYVYLVV